MRASYGLIEVGFGRKWTVLWQHHTVFYKDVAVIMRAHCFGSSRHFMWRHPMETFSAFLALCEGKPPVTGGYPSQRPVTRSFDVFFDLCLNKRLSKQSIRQWFDSHRRGHRLHYNVTNAFSERESNHYPEQRGHSPPKFLGHGCLVASPSILCVTEFGHYWLKLALIDVMAN